MGNQLHKLLAVETDLKNVSAKIKNETITTFNKRDDHFEGFSKTFTALNADHEHLNTTENKEVSTTVADKLKYAQDAILKSINATVSKEETNSSGSAKAMLTVGDVSFGELSATSLLFLEKEISQIRKVYSAIPTLDPSKKWERDEMTEKAIFESPVVKTFRTSKEEDYRTVAPATKEHPAQVVKVTKDVTIGSYETTFKSGKITPLAKSKMLAKLDNLLLAIKSARSVANQAEVVKADVGNKILDYINCDL